MDDQLIVWEMPDGTVRYATCPAKSKKPGETTQQWLHRQFQKTVRDEYPSAKRILNPVMPDGQSFTPGARKIYYEAWRSDGAGNVMIDLPVARGIRMVDIRAERNRRLDDSDREWARLSEVGTPEQQAAHSAYRQALRDVPQSIDLDEIDTAGNLEAFQPAWPEQP